MRIIIIIDWADVNGLFCFSEPGRISVCKGRKKENVKGNENLTGVCIPDTRKPLLLGVD